MIKYLRLENFRRHESTELRFDDAHQVVLISGSNGVGKSTLFEAVLFALYGESRNGRAHIERLVRKGAEIEGMEVEVEFVVGDTTYRARRRRDTKVTSATLYGNEVALVEGPREVSAEVSRILGLDSKGFKLATYAQQRELDGLASMRAGDRGKTLARLLRLDVLTRAKEQARSEFNEHKALAARLSTTVDIAAVEADRAAEQARIGALQDAATQTSDALTVIDAEIATGSGIELRYVESSRHAAAAEARLGHAKSEKGRLEAEIAAVVLPDELPDPGITQEQAQLRGAEVERCLIEAEALERNASQIASLQHEVKGCDEQLDACAVILAGDPADVEAATETLSVARAAQTEASERLALSREQHATLKERLNRAEVAVKKAQALDADCDACGQSVSEDHRHTQAERAATDVAEAQKAQAACEVAGRAERDELELLTVQVAELEGVLLEAQRGVQERSQAQEQKTDTTRRRSVYLSSLERLETVPVNTEELYAERTQIAVTLALLQQRREQETMRSVLLERRVGLQAQLATASDRVTVAELDIAECMVDADLEVAYAAHKQAVEQRQAETAVLAGLQSDVNVAQERLRGIERDLERGRNEAAKRSAVDTAAQVALYASKTLEELEAEWSQQIRPSLEGSVGELLGRLSDGRFDAVKLDTDYNVTVRDDGVFRPLSDLSGGEIDLVALAMRLGLASVVAERHGSGGAGFLILDECFGSQDADRRESILTALRSLRGLYGQIFLVSHVGGLDEAADIVVEIELDEDRVARTEM